MRQEGDGVLSIEECWDLLQSTKLGRVALSVRALPMILPVQYYVEDSQLAVCLGHHKVPPQAVNNAVVAFGADEVDPRSGVGWSVQVQAIARFSETSGVPANCEQLTAGQIVHLVPEHISGYRVELCPFVLTLAGLL